MNEEEKKAIRQIKSELDKNEFMPRLVFQCKDIETVLNLIDKQNKVIDEIIDLLQDNLNFSPLNGLNKQELKQYFIRKVEEDDNSTSK